VDGDCDDLDELISPAADEVCDGADNDCDGDVDDDDSSLDASSGTLFFTDGDGDDYGDSSSSFYACSAPAGAASEGGDCDDAEAAVNPGAEEVCNTGLDEDCSGDENDCGFGGDVPTTDADYSYTGTASVQLRLRPRQRGLERRRQDGPRHQRPELEEHRRIFRGRARLHRLRTSCQRR
jgi:hypothetical protein